MKRLTVMTGFRLCTSLAALVMMTGAVAATDVSQDAARELRRAGTIVALDTIVEHIRRHYPEARLLEADLEKDGGRYIYELEILTREGTVRELDVDASTIEILEDEEED